jgi:predicted transcriptional regulator
MIAMTQLLDQAIKKIRELPEAAQDECAELLLVLAARASGPIPLDDDARSAIREGLSQARRGEFVEDQEIAAVFKPRRG